MPNPLTRKLELFGSLPDEDEQLLDRAVANRRSLKARTSIIQEGEAPADVHVVLSGLACRYKLLPDGSRQIFAYLLPGDFCDLHIFILKEMDHGIETLSPCEIADIPRSRVLEMSRRPELGRALWWATLVDEATLREWLVNLGQRDAFHRIAHLFCELHLRMKSVGLVADGTFSLPITQAELGDTMGLSNVHVNRALQELRASGLIDFKSGVLTISNVDQLRNISDFDSNYLHLSGGKRDNGASASK